jgi:hypothetical protein
VQSDYVSTRDTLNLTKLDPSLLARRPIIPPTQTIPVRIAPFSGKYDAGAWCHFFLDDYRYERVWSHATRYAAFLAKFEGVLSPDFSIYMDDPRAVQRWNHYRNTWCAAFWYHQGLSVIPTISWSDDKSFDWCFDCWPMGGTVAISTLGTQSSVEGRVRFMMGYREMLTRLEPSAVLVYGTRVELPGPAIWYEPFYSTIKRSA